MISEAMKNETAILDDQLIIPLKEYQINRSYYTHVNAKGNHLAFMEKGIFASWPQMKSSKNMTNVTNSGLKW